MALAKAEDYGGGFVPRSVRVALSRELRSTSVREIATSPTRAVVFWDDNIGANPRYAKELFRALTPLKKWWTSQCTANATRDEEFIALAAQSGCKALFLGFESISQKSLELANKAHNRVAD